MLRLGWVNIVIAACVLASVTALGGCGQFSPPYLKPLSAQTQAMLAEKGMSEQSPILVRIFKSESELEVWKAKDARLDRFVAIKVLPEHLTQNTDALARFEREAQLLAQLLDLLRVQDRLAAQANAAARRIDLQDDDLDVATDGERSRNVGFLGNAGLARRDDTGASRGEEHEHAELLVPLDLSLETRAGGDA